MDTPSLHIAPDGTPRSARFDDVYFSAAGGLNESRYVFLQHNRLAERFAALPEHGQFSVCETGFGTGLNFLACWQLFNAAAPATARLTFVSTERYPLRATDIDRALEPWPELADLRQRLVANYPALFEGFHCVEVADNVELLLLLGDAKDTLNDLNAPVNAWFLDGFAPAKNPELWQPSLFDAMARLSRPGATAATFTAARIVRDGLSGAGFVVQRETGFGRKRNMVHAHFIGRCGPPKPGAWPANEWAWPAPSTQRDITLVGAGLAGAHTAWELAQRGWKVRVLEQAEQLAAGASGNAQGAIYARLSARDAVANRFYSQALALAQHRLSKLDDGVPHAACGLLQLNQGDKEAARFAQFDQAAPFPPDFVRRLDASAASDIAGVPIEQQALHFPGGGWVNPAALCAHRLNHPNITVLTGHHVVALSRHARGWQLQCDTAQGPLVLEAAQLILTNAWQAKQLAPTAKLPLNPIAGQVSRIASTERLSALRTVLCSDRYLVPADDGLLSLGATFRLRDNRAEQRPADDADNLAALAHRLPQLIHGDETVVSSRAGVRCASPDYLPLVGPVADADALARLYGEALRKRRTDRLPAVPYYPGLWVNLAHGSKGLTSIPIAAKTLAAWLSDAPLPLPQPVLNALNPNRFELRRLIRGQ